MPKKTMVNLKRLNELMKAKNWGFSELAEYSKVKYDTVYSLAKGRRKNTTLKILTAIATALGTTVDDLLGEESGAPVAAPRLPATIQQIADIAANLSEVRQEELIRIATALQKMEQEQQTLPTPAVEAYMELHEKLRAQGVGADLLALLESLMPPPRRLIHRKRRKRPDEPGQDQGGV